MRKILYLLCLSGYLASCGKIPDPSLVTEVNYSFRFQNTAGEKYLAGESVAGPVVYSAYNNLMSGPNTFKVVFSVVRGGGTLSTYSVNTAVDGTAATNWQLGSGSFEQMITAKAYDPDGKYLTTSRFTALGFRTNQWDTLTGSTESQISAMVADTIDHFTLMITNSHIYRQGARYFDWAEITDQDLVSPRTLHIDSNRILYSSTWNGEVLKSTDHGLSWSLCTKPFPDDPYFIYMYLSNDNYLWAFKAGYPARYSKDSGLTWISAGIGVSGNVIQDIYRLKDGSLLFYGPDNNSLLRSYNYGETWTTIETPAYLYKLYVNDQDEIFICTQENGITIYNSKDFGTSFTKVLNVYPQFGTLMNNTFTRLKNFYYVIIPGYGILKSPDLLHYETYWLNDGLNDLFVDHNGVLIAKDWNLNTIYYRKNSQ